jgi:hypothetical protein
VSYQKLVFWHLLLELTPAYTMSSLVLVIAAPEPQSPEFCALLMGLRVEPAMTGLCICYYNKFIRTCVHCFLKNFDGTQANLANFPITLNIFSASEMGALVLAAKIFEKQCT